MYVLFLKLRGPGSFTSLYPALLSLVVLGCCCWDLLKLSHHRWVAFTTHSLSGSPFRPWHFFSAASYQLVPDVACHCYISPCCCLLFLVYYHDAHLIQCTCHLDLEVPQDLCSCYSLRPSDESSIWTGEGLVHARWRCFCA